MKDFQLTAKGLAIQNQYPHLSPDEIHEYLARTPADHLKNMYPHLNNQEIEEYLARQQQAQQAEEQFPASAPILDSGLGLIFLNGGRLAEDLEVYMGERFPFLDFTQVFDDIKKIASDFVKQAEQHPEFQAAMEKLIAEQRAPVVIGTKKKAPAIAAKKRPSRAKSTKAAEKK